MCSFLELEATWALLDRHTSWTFCGLPIRGVARFSETLENKQFSTPRARPEQVRLGPRIAFSAAAPESGPFLIDVAARISKKSLFDQRSRIDVRRAPNNEMFGRGATSVFSTYVRTGSPKRVANIIFKPARAKRRAPNRGKARKLCMHVMI